MKHCTPGTCLINIEHLNNVVGPVMPDLHNAAECLRLVRSPVQTTTLSKRRIFPNCGTWASLEALAHLQLGFLKYSKGELADLAVAKKAPVEGYFLIRTA